MTERRSPDVVVIGAGAAGLVAAAAAREQGARVLVVAAGDGATAMSSGAVDVADSERALAPSRDNDPFAPSDVRASMERLARELPRHPYALVAAEGRARLEEALALFGALLRGLPLVKRADGKNLVVSSALGTTKRAALACGAVDLGAGGLVERPMAIIAPRALGGFDGVDVKRTLAFVGELSGRALSLTVLDVEHPWSGAPVTALDFARRLDAKSELQDRLVDAIVDAVRTENAGRDAQAKLGVVLLPTPLGVGRAEVARRAIEERTATKTGELLALGLGAHGLRLVEALRAGVRERDVDIVSARVTGARIVDRRVRSLALDEGGVTRDLEADAFVLATGRFLAGGFTDDGVARDVVFGLPVVADGVPLDDRFVGDLVGARPSDLHPLGRAGLVTDELLRPRARDGALFVENLFAAGSTLAGYDPARDGSGLGVAVLTGFLSGARAADAASSTRAR